MKLYYGVYKCGVSETQLESKNELFTALVLIGISREDDILNCFNSDSKYDMLLKNYYNNNGETMKYCTRGKKFIYKMLDDRNIKIRKRKCMNFVFTEKGRHFYTDITITEFAKTIFQVINNDLAMKKAFEEILSVECESFKYDTNKVELSDCVQHLFGFQYEILSRIVLNRQNPQSKKSCALRKTLNEMRQFVGNAGYPCG
jgi:hypothetical protein